MKARTQEKRKEYSNYVSTHETKEANFFKCAFLYSNVKYQAFENQLIDRSDDEIQ